MTEIDRLLAAGDALADAADITHEVFGVLPEMLEALREWRALAREVRKEKGDDA